MPDAITTDRRNGPAGGGGASNRWAVLAMVAAFVICLLPYASDFIIFQPDEDHYVQGALIMMETGDYLTPRTGDNSLRLLKPPLAYWLNVAGMEVFGISVLGIRVFWLVMAAGILLLTARLARLLTASGDVALLAAAMLAPNLLFIRLTLTVIPDAPLIFFMLLATNGFVGLLTAPEPRRSDAWMAYGGTALAILTKGLLPLVMAVYFAAAALLFPAVRAKARRLVAPLPIVVSLAVAASWFLYQILSRPEAFYQQFVGDQVSEKVGVSAGSMLNSLAVSGASLVLPLAAWLLVLATASWASRRRPKLTALGAAAALLAGWIVVNLLLFVPAQPIYVRYILPALPVFAVLVAAALASLDRDVVRRHLQLLLILGIVLAGPLLAAVLAITAPLMDPFTVAALAAALAVAIVVLWLAARSKSLLFPVLANALLPVGALFFVSPSITVLAMPDMARVISDELQARDLSDAGIVFLDAPREAAKAQVYERRTAPYQLVAADEQALAALDAERPPVIVTRDKALADRLTGLGYDSAELKGGWRDIDTGVLIDALRAGKLPQAREAHAERVYFLTRPSEN